MLQCWLFAVDVICDVFEDYEADIGMFVDEDVLNQIFFIVLSFSLLFVFCLVSIEEVLDDWIYIIEFSSVKSPWIHLKTLKHIINTCLL